MPSDTLTIEIELKPIAEGMEHDLSYINEDVKAFFEQFGWRVLWSSFGGESEETEEDE